MKGDRYFICNIISDEKFIDGAIECFDLYADKWDMQWIICQNINQELKYIKRHSERVFNISENVVLQYLAENKFDAVILHSFGVVSPIIIKQIPKEIKVFWFGWGYDIYNYPTHRPFLKWNLYKPLTVRYVNSSLYSRLRNIVSKLRYVLFDYEKRYKMALNRVDYFAGVMDFEYDLMRQNLNFRAQKVSFSYTSLSILKSYEKKLETHDGNNILVGNSAATTNNHLDLLEYLKTLNLQGRKLILPLSYAGSKEYVNIVATSYRKIFGDNFVALTDFMPYDEYKKYILSCDTAIFFMNRQQAMGNINTSIQYGCKVFLSENNPVFNYYKSIGIKLFSIEKDLNDTMLNQPLCMSEIEQNMQIIKTYNNKSAYLKKLDTIYDALENDVTL